MISVILVDDEMPALKELKYSLSSYDDIHICGMYTNPLEALKDIERIKPDAVFLDMDMPCITGIEFAVKIQNINVKIEIIFVTAHEEFAVDAFEVQAMDYILKPITEKRFKKSMYDLTKVLFYDFDDKKALNNLYVSMFHLRRQLKDFGIKGNIMATKGKYDLEIGNGICDYVDFDRFLNKQMIVDNKNINEFEKIIELYKGPFLEEDDYLWSVEIREYTAEKYEDLLLAVVNYYENKADLKKAESNLLKLLSVNPLSEEGNRKLLDIYITSKNNRYFLKQYELYEKLLKEEFRTIPDIKYQYYYHLI